MAVGHVQVVVAPSLRYPRGCGFMAATACIPMSSSCRLWEISENLHRAELTALERDKLVAEWVELTGEVSEQNVPKPQGGRPESGVRLAARQLPVEGKTDDAKRMSTESATGPKRRS